MNSDSPTPTLVRIGLPGGRPRARVLSIALVLSAVLAAGCGGPHAGAENVELISSLRTAASARNPEWLEANVKVIDERHVAGQISEVAYAAFRAIIEKAQAGQWREAERDAVAFQKAQRPTREQVERLRRHAQ
jgi:hypothetical protein